jgi:hypothetical protein
VKDIIKVLIFIIIIWCIVSAVTPYWYKRGLGKELEIAVIYGTKHSIQETRKFLGKKMKEEGYNFRGEDFTIEKDENNTVFIGITYTDEIRIFGVTLKELRFNVERKAFEFQERF